MDSQDHEVERAINRSVDIRSGRVGPRGCLCYVDQVATGSRSEVRIGQHVSIVLKEHQRSGELTQGVVAAILTRSATHPHGIKVRLESGQVGRVKIIHGGA